VTSSVLLLNTSYEPLGVVSIQRAVRLLFCQKAEIVYDNGALLHSAGNKVTKKIIEFPMPSVIRMLYYITHRKRGVTLTKRNVLLRDNFQCGYCSLSGDATTLTVDHVTPKSRGGKSTWLNLAACCEKCNSRKRDRTPQEAGMTLQHKLHVPNFIPWVVIKRTTMPHEWKQFLLGEISIEERVG
jgi:5-methylcytosine-specific restriction endonuclease McrA